MISLRAVQELADMLVFTLPTQEKDRSLCQRAAK